MKTLRLTGAPNPKQQAFFLSTAPHTAYGGARGGGADGICLAMVSRAGCGGPCADGFQPHSHLSPGRGAGGKKYLLQNAGFGSTMIWLRTINEVSL